MDTPFIITLSFVAFFASIFTASFGLGGGIFLVSLLGVIMTPVAAIVPIHGVVQLASNMSRAALSFRQIRWPLVIQFAVGALLGAAIGSQIVVALDEQVFGVLLGTMIIVFLWLPRFEKAPKLPKPFVFVGLASSFMSMFVGVSGPLAAPFFKRACDNRFAFITTDAAAHSFIHIFKIWVFWFVIGFSFAPYLWLLAGMVTGALAGSWVGMKVLGRLNETAFDIAFKLMCSALAVYLIVRSAM